MGPVLTHTRPPLKTAPVFGGIAGIMAGEQGESDDTGQLPTMSSKNRELGELQDMYRRALAASWGAQADELPADECIEDIFAGGDGWSKKVKRTAPVPRGAFEEDDGSGSVSDNESMRTPPPKRGPMTFARHAFTKPASKPEHLGNRAGMNMGPEGGRGSVAHQAQQNKSDDGHSHEHMYEFDELDIREDLRSWQIS